MKYIRTCRKAEILKQRTRSKKERRGLSIGHSKRTRDTIIEPVILMIGYITSTTWYNTNRYFIIKNIIHISEFEFRKVYY